MLVFARRSAAGARALSQSRADAPRRRPARRRPPHPVELRLELAGAHRAREAGLEGGALPRRCRATTSSSSRSPTGEGARGPGGAPRRRVRGGQAALPGAAFEEPERRPQAPLFGGRGALWRRVRESRRATLNGAVIAVPCASRSTTRSATPSTAIARGAGGTPAPPCARRRRDRDRQAPRHRRAGAPAPGRWRVRGRVPLPLQAVLLPRVRRRPRAAFAHVQLGTLDGAPTKGPITTSTPARRRPGIRSRTPSPSSRSCRQRGARPRPGIAAAVPRNSGDYICS